MKKRCRTYVFFKAAAIVVCLPVIIFFLLIIMLYIPPVQRFAVEKVCNGLSSSTGYEINIGTFHLAFPLKLSIADYFVSRNDTVFIDGNKAEVNISFMPLLKGEVEVNYVSVEQTKLNTANLIEGVAVNGEIGFFRAVARNVDIEKQNVNLRQVFLHSTDIDIALSDTTESEEEEPLHWVINLHRGGIENCRVNINMPLDTLSLSAGIGKLRLRNGVVDLGTESYTIERLAMSNSRARYDVGAESRAKEPLKHIEVENINIACKDIAYTPNHTGIDIERFTMIQPGGVRITNAEAQLLADRKELYIKKLSLKSRNGSKVEIESRIPWQAITGSYNESLAATALLALDKRDLKAILTEEEYGLLSIFDNRMLNVSTKIKGSLAKLDIRTFDMSVPSLAELHASGEAKNLNDIEKLEARLNLKDTTGKLRKLLTSKENDSIGEIDITVNGNIGYNSGEANADLAIRGFGGRIETSAMYNINTSAYNADISLSDIDISTLPFGIPISRLTAKLHADGEGFNIFDEETGYGVNLLLDTVVYDNIRLNSISLTAQQKENISKIVLASDSRDFKFNIKANTELKENDIRNKTDIEIKKADFMMIGLTDVDLGTEMKVAVEASTDMMERHAVKLHGKDLKIITEKKTFTPDEISLDISTTPEFSYIHADNGDLHIHGNMKSGYTGLFKAMEKIKGMFHKSMTEENVSFYLHDYEKAIPDLKLEFKCGKRNMLHNFLAMSGLGFNNMNLDATLNEKKGIDISGGVYGFKSGELNLDTIRILTRQEEKKIRYLAGVRSTTLNPQNEKMTFNAMLYGNIFNDSVTTNFMFRDKKDGVGIRLGIKTLVSPKELDIKFRPDAVLFGSRFSFDEENYIRIGKGYSINADVTLTDEHDAGMHLFTAPENNSRINANLELFNVNLKKLTGMLPFVPDIGGMLNMDLYYKLDEKDMLLSSDIRVDSISYEGTHIGNESLEVVYFPKENNKHYLDVILSHDGEEVAHLDGDYIDEGSDPGLHGSIALTSFPLGITKAFLKDTGMKLDGYVNSELSAEGKLSSLTTDGYVQFDSVYLNAPLLGADLHLSDKMVNIKNNKIEFKDFDIFAKGENPFKMNGTVDMSKLSDPAFNLRMNANDYELINSPRQRGSILYGRMFIDFRAFIGGTLKSMKIYGNATLLGKSNITYVMQDAPISTDKELDGLVEFVNFADTTKTKEVEEEADFGNNNISLGLKIEDGARINADLDANRNSYVNLRGGGNLNMTYTGDNGLNVTGTYEMSEGELKYELPIIPLKTFSIVDGSKVTWNGDILDPTIEITALERVTTSVSMDDGGTQPVAFDVGVKLSNTLSDMGLTFTISAPENAMVQDQLNSLDAETLNKYAVTMLITGTYIGNSKGMSVSNALNSFLDAQINQLAGSAMKSVSVDVGINDAENAETGGTYKNYSFSFKKRFWNDRITIVIGGEVNSGDHPTANDSFINNVSLEWKISDSSNRYLRLFYDKNYESLLEGEIIETGIGYVYKRKLQNLRELFMFKKNKEKKSTEKGDREKR